MLNRTRAAGFLVLASLARAEEGAGPRVLAGDPGGLRALAFSPDGKTLATGGNDRTVRLWDLATLKRIRVMEGHADVIRSLAFSPDGRALASGAQDNTARLWDPATGKETLQLGEHQGWVYSVAFSLDGKTLATGSEDKSVRLWDLASLKATPFQNHGNRLLSVAFSPDGKRVAYPCTDNSVHVLDLASGKESRVLLGHTNFSLSVAFSPDGRALASAGEDGTVLLWDLLDGGTLLEAKQPGAAALSVAFSPDGRLLASSRSDGTVRVWDASSGDDLLRLSGARGCALAVAFSPDGRTLASGNQDGSCLLWEIPSALLSAVEPKPLSPGEREARWAALLSEDPAEANRARRDLARDDPAFLGLKLSGQRDAARDPGHTGRLLRLLDDDSFDAREKASQDLGSLGGFAEEVLRKALEGSPSAEVRERLRLLLEDLDPPRSECLRQRRALGILERAATPRAREILGGLAGAEPGTALEREAKACLDRMGRKASPSRD